MCEIGRHTAAFSVAPKVADTRQHRLGPVCFQVHATWLWTMRPSQFCIVQASCWPVPSKWSVEMMSHVWLLMVVSVGHLLVCVAGMPHRWLFCIFVLAPISSMMLSLEPARRHADVLLGVRLIVQMMSTSIARHGLLHLHTAGRLCDPHRLRRKLAFLLHLPVT